MVERRKDRLKTSWSGKCQQKITKCVKLLLWRYWKTFSGVFKEDLFYFSKYNFQDFYFFIYLLPYSVILSWYHLLMYYDVLVHEVWSHHQSYLTGFLFQRRQLKLKCVKMLLWKLLRKLLHYLPQITLQEYSSFLFWYVQNWQI